MRSRNITFITSIEDSKVICSQRLMHCKVVAVDVEGVNLGYHGVVSLIQVAVSEFEIYIFDVLVLGNEVFDASNLLPVFTNPCILKLCYDARCDCETLFARYGIRAFGFYDLQIVYTLLFQQQGDPYLKGLHRAMQAPGLLFNPADVANKVSRKRQWSASKTHEFFERPLPQDLLDYCAADVACLMIMHKAWSSRVSQVRIVVMTQQRIVSHIYCKSWNRTMSRVDFCVPQMHLYHKLALQHRSRPALSHQPRQDTSSPLAAGSESQAVADAAVLVNA